MNSTYDEFNIEDFHTYAKSVIILSTDFERQLKTAYKENVIWAFILKILQIIFNINKLRIDFILHERLIYYKKNNNSHLYISAAFKKKIFKITHNDNMHEKCDKALQ